MALPLLDFFPSPSPSRELADALLFSFLFFSAGSGLNGFLAILIRFPKPDPEFRLALRGGVRIFARYASDSAVPTAHVLQGPGTLRIC